MQAEEIMEKKIASAMEVCKKYNRIKADGKKAEAVWLQVIWDHPEKEARVLRILSRELW